jgi:hypothetical protein
LDTSSSDELPCVEEWRPPTVDEVPPDAAPPSWATTPTMILASVRIDLVFASCDTLDAPALAVSRLA